jgi:hypothetical protein
VAHWRRLKALGGWVTLNSFFDEPTPHTREEVDGVVEGERPVEDRARDLAAVGHLAERRSLDRRRDLRVHGLHRGENGHPHVSTRNACARSIAFWTISTFSSRDGAMLIAASVTISAEAWR